MKSIYLVYDNVPCLSVYCHAACSFIFVFVLSHTFSYSYASINVKPEGGGGGTPGICGAFDFSEEFLVKIPTVGPQNLAKSDQISPP